MTDATIEPEAYYQDFSLQVGLRDWALPNARHEQLALLVDDFVGARRGMRILDIGCGAGVMTGKLRRYGEVTGSDFSRPAVDVAAALVPGGSFHAGPLEHASLQGPFDLITMFDVVEHLPVETRDEVFAKVGDLLAEPGMLIVSTPNPKHTRWIRRAHPDLLQVVDEEVELADMIDVAGGIGLELTAYTAFDVGVRRDYHAFRFETEDEPPGTPMRDPRLRRRMRTGANAAARVARRAPHALNLARAGRPALARWLLWPRGKPPRS